MEKLATGLTVLTLLYTTLVLITLMITGWFGKQDLTNLLKPVKLLIHNYWRRNSGVPS